MSRDEFRSQDSPEGAHRRRWSRLSWRSPIQGDKHFADCVARADILKETLRFVHIWGKMKKCSPVNSDYLLEIYFYWGRQLAAGAKEVMNDYDYSDYTFLEFCGALISSGMRHFGRR